jgi:hypothetical protein
MQTIPQTPNPYTNSRILELVEKHLNTNSLELLGKGDSNAKTAKNILDTKILYLSPHKANSLGVNLCPKADLCINPCLFESGRAIVYKSVIVSRIAKTEFYLKHRQEFCKKLGKEITKLYAKAINTNSKICLRINGTSDLDFIQILKNRIGLDLLEFSTTYESDKSGLLLYDYTKVFNYVKKYHQTNYTLCFSHQKGNEKECNMALELGNNVSAVFRKQLPKEYSFDGLSHIVTDGDKSDIEMLMHKSKILGLVAKGKAITDKSGFVID